MRKILFYIMKVLSWSPFFRISDDSNYNRLDFNWEKLRVSFLSITLGIWSFYLLSWTKDSKLKFFSKLNLKRVQDLNDNSKNYDIQYEKYLEELTDSEKHSKNKLIEKEFLLRRLNEIEIQNSKVFNKFLAYIAILVFLIPLYANKITQLTPYILTYKIIFILIMVYSVLNILFISYEFLKVKGIRKVTFNEIRTSGENVEENFIAILFYEWKHRNKESRLEVSLIKNLEKFMWILVVLSLCIVVISNLESKTIQFKSQEIKSSQNLINFSLETKTSAYDFFEINNHKIKIVIDSILDEKYNKVIVISNNSHINEKISELLSLYKNVNIVKVESKDFSNDLKIILIKE